MYKLRQRKAAATFRVLFYIKRQQVQMNHLIFVLLLVLKREAMCTAQTSVYFTTPTLLLRGLKVKTTCLACITLPGACLTRSKGSSRKTTFGFVSK